MTELRLRPARAFDAAECAAIVNRWIDGTPWLPRIHTPESVIRHYREDVFPRQSVTVAEAKGAVVGFLARDGDWVTSLYVGRPGIGIGAALLTEAKAAQASLHLWTFQANTGARRFYQREGLVEGRRSAADNDEKLPDIEYLWGPT